MTSNGEVVVLKLDYDENKVLKRGKRVYKDEDGHALYLQGDEVQKLDSPEAIELEIRPL